MILFGNGTATATLSGRSAPIIRGTVPPYNYRPPRRLHGSDAVDDIISRSELWLGKDYNEHERELQAQIDAIREELGA